MPLFVGKLQMDEQAEAPPAPEEKLKESPKEASKNEGKEVTEDRLRAF